MGRGCLRSGGNISAQAIGLNQVEARGFHQGWIDKDTLNLGAEAVKLRHLYGKIMFFGDGQ